jgi:glycogen(starch) synthase
MELRDKVKDAGKICSVINLTRHKQLDHDGLYFPQSPSDVLKCVNALKPDIVHVHFGGHLFARQAALLLALCMRSTSRNLLTFHSGGFPSSQEGRAARPMSLRGFALRQLDAVIGVNAELAKTFARYGVPDRKIHMIEPFGGRTSHDQLAGVALPEVISTFAEAHRPLLLAVGLLEPEYGIDIQLEALTLIRKQCPGAGLLLIGSGSLHAKLASAIAAHPDRDHILLYGDLARPMTLAAISSADVLLRTTHYDGDALSVREALALGTRVLASDNGMRPQGVHCLATLDVPSLALAVPRVLAVPKATTPRAPDANPMNTVLSLYESLAT